MKPLTIVLLLLASTSAGCKPTKRPPKPIPPPAPVNLTAIPMSPAEVALAWTDGSTNETGFRVERSTDALGPFSLIATTGANVTAYADGDLAAATTYYYRVCAYNAVGPSAYSNIASATTEALPPPEPPEPPPPPPPPPPPGVYAWQVEYTCECYADAEIVIPGLAWSVEFTGDGMWQTPKAYSRVLRDINGQECVSMTVNVTTVQVPTTGPWTLAVSVYFDTPLLTVRQETQTITVTGEANAALDIRIGGGG